jgi:hypothetical protein
MSSIRWTVSFYVQLNFEFTTLKTFRTASPIDTVLGIITAQDPDTGSRVQYSILPETIKAKDQDGKVVTGNTQVDYRVRLTLFSTFSLFRSFFGQQNAFKIDPDTGALSIASPLDGTEVAEMEFTVQAEDVNAPTKQTSTCKQHRTPSYTWPLMLLPLCLQPK